MPGNLRPRPPRVKTIECVLTQSCAAVTVLDMATKKKTTPPSKTEPTRSVSLRLTDDEIDAVDRFGRAFEEAQNVDMNRARTLAILVRRGLKGAAAKEGGAHG